VALPLAAQQINSLITAGQTGSAEVIEQNGHSYVDVVGLAQLIGSSISFNGNQVVMTLPGATASAPTVAPPKQGFSKSFVTAGIEAMAEIREWRAALKDAIEHSYRLSEDWLEAPRAQAQHTLRLASIAVSTNSDKNVLPFLTNEFRNMDALTNKYLQLSAANTYIETNSLVSQSLASMVTANQFIDDGSCQ
jgi:hypothetical protein